VASVRETTNSIKKSRSEKFARLINPKGNYICSFDSKNHNTKIGKNAPSWE